MAGLTQEEWRAVIGRLTSRLTVMPPTVRRDLDVVLRVLQEQSQQLEGALQEVQGVRQTLIALAKDRGGWFDVSFKDIEDLSPRDALHIEDIEIAPGVIVKRFTASQRPEATTLVAPYAQGPRRAQ